MTDTPKHPDCEDRCQLKEHKGYDTCQVAGLCQQLEDEKINAYAETMIRKDRIGRTFHRVCMGSTANGEPYYEQVEI